MYFSQVNRTLRVENQFNSGVTVFWGKCCSRPMDLSRQSFSQEKASFSGVTENVT